MIVKTCINNGLDCQSNPQKSNDFLQITNMNNKLDKNNTKFSEYIKINSLDTQKYLINYG